MTIVSCRTNSFSHYLVELVSWAIFLMHEFIIKDVAREEFCQLQGLLKVLLTLLAEESTIPRIVLRSLKCLGKNNEVFQLEMISAETVPKILVFLKSPDEETQFWAMSLLRDLMEFTEAHDGFLSSNGLSAITTACTKQSPSVHIALFSVDIFVSLCGVPKNRSALEESDIWESVIAFTSIPDHDVQYSVLALLLSLASVSDRMVESIITNGILEIVTDFLLDSSLESIQIVAGTALPE